MNVLFQKSGGEIGPWMDALSSALPEAAIARWPQDRPSRVDYALVWKPPAEVLPALAAAKAVFNLGAGVDAVLAMDTWPRHVPLIRLEDAGMAEQMCEYVAYAVLRWYREFDAYADAQRDAAWRQRPRLAKPSFSVGILGLGVLGAEIAATLKSLGFPVLGWSRTPKRIAGVRDHGPGELDAFLRASRVLVCALPLTPSTRGMLDRDALSRLPRGAYLINIARGPLCVDEDVLALLDHGHLAGALLDVFPDEPLPAAHPFWRHPRVVVTPHVSAVTLIDESVAQIAGKIRRLEAGLSVTGVVDAVEAY